MTKNYEKQIKLVPMMNVEETGWELNPGEDSSRSLLRFDIEFDKNLIQC